MEIIVIAGQAHSVGKTTLASLVIQNLGSSVGAIKCSIHAGEDELVTTRPDIIRQERTDTDLLAASGAEQVVYLLSDTKRLKASLEQAQSLIGEMDYLVIEGNSVLDYVIPDLTIYINRQGVEVKPSAEKAEALADIIVDSDDLQAHLAGGLKEVPFQFKQTHLPCYRVHLLAKTWQIALEDLGKMMDDHHIKVNWENSLDGD